MKKVLIVDDELLVRMGFRSILDWESCGFTVVGDAENGEEALEKIRLLQPDLVFTDLKMDRMDGLELMSACMREYPAVKFIVLSSYNDFENVRQAMRCGALDYRGGHPGGGGTRELRADVSRRALGAAVQADHGGYR